MHGKFITYSLVCARCGKSFPRTTDRKPKARSYCAFDCGRYDSLDRVWQDIDRFTNPAGCWPWTRSVNHDGYGKLWSQGRTQGVHRVVFELVYGPIPAGMFVCHRCDNPPCCRPDHLFLGSDRDNVRDMTAKGRRATSKGEQASRAKLTQGDVEMIRASYVPRRITMAILAERYHVALSTIAAIIYRTNWKHLG